MDERVNRVADKLHEVLEQFKLDGIVLEFDLSADASDGKHWRGTLEFTVGRCRKRERKDDRE